MGNALVDSLQLDYNQQTITFIHTTYYSQSINSEQEYTYRQTVHTYIHINKHNRQKEETNPGTKRGGGACIDPDEENSICIYLA